MEKKYSVAIIGCGSRGRDAYGRLFVSRKEQWEVVAICDVNEVNLNNAKEMFGLKGEACYKDEKEFFEAKRADLLVIATQDKDHVRMAKQGLLLGYDILLEKPISKYKEELEELVALQKKTGRKVMVCHVLRYAPAFQKIKELIESGKLGKIMSINATEQVGYWHFSHSYVRGNWRNEKESSPIIMAKSCHDLDLLQDYIGAKCKTAYSVGGIKYFNKANKPEGAADRCQNCKYINTCPYSAENLYVKRWKEENCLKDCWPFNVVCEEIPNTEERLRHAYENNPYGRCVFECDNDVCDTQSCVFEFENGVIASFNLTGVTNRMGRKICVNGSLGFAELDETEGLLKIGIYGEGTEVIKEADLLKELGKDSFGHGGGDAMLLGDLYKMLSNESMPRTSLENSVESHLMAIAAEESRKTGKAVNVH